MLDVLTAINTTASGITSLIELSSGIKNSELQRQLAELNRQVADIQNEVASLLDKNRKLNDKIKTMENEQKAPLVFNPKDNFYYDENNDVPYCPTCYETKRLRIHIIMDSYECKKCKSKYRDRPVVAAVSHPGERWPLP